MSRITAQVLLAATLVCAAAPVLAGPFLGVAESVPLDVAEIEIIQGVAGHGGEPGERWALEFQSSVDVGLPGGVQLGFGLPGLRTCRREEGLFVESGEGALWGLWNLRRPASDRAGLAVAATVARSSESRCARLELAVERPLGTWTWVGNGGLGRSWSSTVPEVYSAGHLIARQGVTRPLAGAVALGLEWEANWERPHGGTWGGPAHRFGPLLALDGGTRWLTAGWMLATADGDVAGSLQLQAGLLY